MRFNITILPSHDADGFIDDNDINYYDDIDHDITHDGYWGIFQKVFHLIITTDGFSFLFLFFFSPAYREITAISEWGRIDIYYHDITPCRHALRRRHTRKTITTIIRECSCAATPPCQSRRCRRRHVAAMRLSGARLGSPSPARPFHAAAARAPRRASAPRAAPARRHAAAAGSRRRCARRRAARAKRRLHDSRFFIITMCAFQSAAPAPGRPAAAPPPSAPLPCRSARRRRRSPATRHSSEFDPFHNTRHDDDGATAQRPRRQRAAKTQSAASKHRLIAPPKRLRRHAQKAQYLRAFTKSRMPCGVCWGQRSGQGANAMPGVKRAARNTMPMPAMRWEW